MTRKGIERRGKCKRMRKNRKKEIVKGEEGEKYK